MVAAGPCSSSSSSRRRRRAGGGTAPPLATASSSLAIDVAYATHLDFMACKCSMVLGVEHHSSVLCSTPRRRHVEMIHRPWSSLSSSSSSSKIWFYQSSPRLWGSWISPSKKERERRRKGEKRGKKKIRKNKREGLVHPSKSSKLKILTMSKVPEVAVERKSSAGHNVSLSRRMLLPMDDLDSLTLPL